MTQPPCIRRLYPRKQSRPRDSSVSTLNKAQARHCPADPTVFGCAAHHDHHNWLQQPTPSPVSDPPSRFTRAREKKKGEEGKGGREMTGGGERIGHNSSDRGQGSKAPGQPVSHPMASDPSPRARSPPTASMGPIQGGHGRVHTPHSHL